MARANSGDPPSGNPELRVCISASIMTSVRVVPSVPPFTSKNEVSVQRRKGSRNHAASSSTERDPYFYTTGSRGCIRRLIVIPSRSPDGPSTVIPATGGEPPRIVAQGFDYHRTSGRGFLQVPFQAVDVRIDRQHPAVASFDPLDDVVEVEPAVLYRAQFTPDAMGIVSRRQAGQPHDTAVECVSLACPGGAQAAGLVVQLEDPGFYSRSFVRSSRRTARRCLRQ
jgi:hypothetical protein